MTNCEPDRCFWVPQADAVAGMKILCVFCGRKMEVKRVHERGKGGLRLSSHIEPAMEADWSEAMKLTWHAMVVALDTGLNISIREFPTNWNLIVERHSIALREFQTVWDYLSGISVGVAALTQKRQERLDRMGHHG